MITTIAVSVDGDAATSTSYFLAVSDTVSSPRIGMIGVYNDAFRREGGSWKIAARRITLG